jgi:septal ring factor EnvC (AmiA/AmiB activator)
VKPQFAVVLAVMLASVAAPALAQRAPVPAAPATPAEKEAAAREREALRKRLDTLRKDIASREGERAEAADALQASEEEISRSTRRLAEIGVSQKQVQTELQQLDRRIAAEQTRLDNRQKELGTLLRRQYAGGSLSPWSALLSGDDPHEMGRNLAYLGYISQARANAVNTVREEIAQLTALQADAAARRKQVDELAAEEKTERDALQKQSAERKRIFETIAADIQAQRREVDATARNEARMSALVDELTRTLARQAEEARRAERARKEAAERAERIAREAAQRAAQRSAEKAAEREAAERAAAARAEQRAAERSAERSGTPPVIAAPPAPVPDAPPLRPAEPLPPVPEAPPERAVARNDAVPDASISGNFERLRGRLRLPVKGEVVGRFGTARGEGGVWRGVFLRAGEGAQVRAVAPGEVVFANWLRGFGNLIIVDHGGEYLSIYGNNQTLFKQVGDQIRAGDVVAGVGATGGQTESGLYFELRHRGKPMDPLQWVSLQ